MVRDVELVNILVNYQQLGYFEKAKKTTIFIDSGEEKMRENNLDTN